MTAAQSVRILGVYRTLDQYRGGNNSSTLPVSNLMNQFNQPYPHYQGFSRQNDILGKLMEEMNSSRSKPSNNDELMNRLDQLEEKNRKLRKQIKQEQERNSAQMPPSAPPAPSPWQFNPMGGTPYFPMAGGDPNKNKETSEERRKREKAEKKQRKKEKKARKKEKERKRRHKERERIRRQNPDISFSSSDDSDLESSSDDYGMDEEEKNKRQLDKMIKEVDRSDMNKHQKELDKLRDRMAQDKYFKSDMLKSLGLPDLNKNEDMKFEVPDDDAEFNKLEENRKRRAEKLAEHDRMTNLLEKMGLDKKRQRLRGKAKFAVFARTVYEFVHLLRLIRGREIKKREDHIAVFKEGLLLYVDVAKAWIIK